MGGGGGGWFDKLTTFGYYQCPTLGLVPLLSGLVACATACFAEQVTERYMEERIDN